MKRDDEVLVYPHGNPKQAARARVALVSSNGRSIAVGFDERPPFAIGDPLSMAIHPDYGIVLFAWRGVLDGKPWGPWVEMIGGGHYEIEAIAAKETVA